MNYLFKLSLFLVFLPLFSFTNKTSIKQEKTKTINKEYTVSKNATISIDNRYGNINISSWNQNTVRIEVSITVKGNNESKIERTLEGINVDFTANSNAVSAKTMIDGVNNGWSFWGSNNRNINYKINYEVKMPVTNNVILNNNYGSVFLDNLEGTADITCDYGNVNLGSLQAKNNKINLDYCNGSTIGYMAGGDINVDYSKIRVEDSNTVKVNSDYSGVSIEQVESIDFNSDYGSIRIGTCTSAIGNSDYAALTIDEVMKNIEIDASYGSLSIEELSRSIENVKIDSKYTAVRIGYDPSASFRFLIDLKYTNLKGDLDAMSFSVRDTKPTKKYYEGSYGTNPSQAKMEIYSQYGGLTLTQNN